MWCRGILNQTKEKPQARKQSILRTKGMCAYSRSMSVLCKASK